MATFQDVIFMLQDVGVADVLLPFLLIFTVVFAILQKTKILGKKDEAKKFNVIIALVMGMGVIFPHVLGYYPPTSDPVTIINTSLPSVAVIAIAIIMVMLLLGTFGYEFGVSGNSINGGIMLFCFGAVAYIFGTNAGFWGNGQYPRFLWFLADPNTQSLLVVILVFGIIVWLITREDKKDDKSPKWHQAIVPIGGKDDDHGGGHHG